MKSGFSSNGWRRRGGVVLRIIAAIPLAYVVAILWAMALARLLPGGRANATMFAILLSFPICAGAAMWACAARSGWRAVWTLALLAILGGAGAWLSIVQGGRL